MAPTSNKGVDRIPPNKNGKVGTAAESHTNLIEENSGKDRPLPHNENKSEDQIPPQETKKNSEGRIPPILSKKKSAKQDGTVRNPTVQSVHPTTPAIQPCLPTANIRWPSQWATLRVECTLSTAS